MQNNDLNFYLLNDEYRDHAILELPLYLRLEKDQKPTPIHQHQYVELAIVTEGKALHRVREDSCVITKGDVLVIPRGVAHTYEETEHLGLANLLFAPESLPMPRLDLGNLPGFHSLFFPDRATSVLPCPQLQLNEEELAGLQWLLVRMDEECRHRQFGGNFRLLGAFMLLLGKLAALTPDHAPQPRRALSFQLGKLLSFLNAKFRSPITLADLLARVPMSRSTLNRRFLRATGMTPMRYLQHLRLEHALELLRSTDLPVTEIAIASGFADSSHFSRLFHETYHLSPRAYRMSGAPQSARKPPPAP